MKGSVAIVRHRVNRLAELSTLDRGWGAEIDIRSRNGRLILTHDPFTNGDSLENFVRAFSRQKQRGILILNTKEDGLETEILKILERFRVRNYFFLDTTIPTTVRLAVRHKIKRIAVRVSEYEPADAAMKFKGIVDWVWLDCFTGRPPSAALLSRLKRHFKVCLVSPELQGYPPASIQKFKKLRPRPDAVCTKYPALWQSA